MRAVTLVVEPPDDGAETEEDSGDEDHMSPDNFSGAQLRASADIQINDENVDDIDARQTWPNSSETNWSSRHLEDSSLPNQILFEKHFNDSVSTPVDFFELFFDNEVIELIVTETNHYARTVHADHSFSTTNNEIRCFLGLLLLSGYATVPRWRMWWQTNTETHNPVVTNSMRRNRFDLLKKYLHVADNESLEQSDKYAKVRPLLAMVNERFLRHAPLERKLCIDETMVPYFGRHSGKQYLKGKPMRYGYKLWSLATRLGYLVQCEPYQKTEASTELGLGGQVVLDLLSELPTDENLPYHVYGDRFFSSVKLVRHLSVHNVHYTGTILPNRTEKCPVIDEKVNERGDFVFKTSTESIQVVKWHDNRPVLMISNADDVLPVTNASRWCKRAKNRVDVPQPNTVRQYNEFMGGVDRFDQNVNQYRVAIRSKKWWWPLFAFCIDAACQNAWQLYRSVLKMREETPIDLLAFRRHIARTYLKLETDCGRTRLSSAVSTRVLPDVRYDGLNHWIQVIATQRRCALCGKKSTRVCEKCDVGLHDVCFKSYHSR